MSERNVDTEAARPRRRGRILLALVTIVVLLAAGGAAWWFVVGPEDDGADDPVDGEILDLAPLTTTTGQDQLRHARIALAVVLVDGVDPEAVEPQVPLLKDALLREVASLSADDLRSQQGSDRLRTTLTAHAIEIWGEEVVRRVVLTELMVQ